MDTSEQYIKMCEGAEEIQKGKEKFFNHIGNTYYLRDCKFILEGNHCFGGDFFGVGSGGKNLDMQSNSGIVWLPRQDQLQEMALYEGRELTGLLQEFIHFVYEIRYPSPNESNSAIRYFASMEQLWLAFVISQRWNKIWNGEDWIESKKH